MEESPVSKALDALSLAEVWELAPDNSVAPTRDGLVFSPFRENTNSPAFSVFDGLRRFKDHAEDSKAAGVWDFVARCRPEWSRQDIARYLCERAGLAFPDSSAQKPKANQPGLPNAGKWYASKKNAWPGRSFQKLKPRNR